MTAKLTPQLRLRNAQDFLDNLVNHPITPPQTAADGSHKVDRNHYLFIGRTKEWPTNLLSNPVVSETSPPTPMNTISEELDIRDHMLALKKVRDIDATLCVRRYNWDSSGQTIYAAYDTKDPDLYNHPTPAELQAANVSGTYKAGSHWVVTDEYHIFKCLSNGNGSKSTIKPTLPLSPPYTVASVDGYIWKYLGTVSQFFTQYFLTNQWLPVKTLTADDGSNQWDVQTSATNGSIDSYKVSAGGTGYANTHSGAFTAATSTTAQLPNSGGVSLVDDTYNGSHVWITGGVGFPSGPFTVTDYDGATRSITISGSWSVSSGTTYEILPRVVVSGNGTGATAKATVDTVSQKVTAVTPVAVGTGYTYASAQVFGGTSGAVATIIPQIPPRGGHGSNIERELNASYVMLTARLVYDDGSGDFPLANDYRQVGLIRDVLSNSGVIANQTTLRAVPGIVCTNVAAGVGGQFQPDELISVTNGVTTAQARIVSVVPGVSPTDATIYYYQDSSTGYTAIGQGFAVLGTATGATATVATGGVLSPEITKSSGDILYIDNRRSVLRAPNQTEVIRAVIKF